MSLETSKENMRLMIFVVLSVFIVNISPETKITVSYMLILVVLADFLG